MSSRVALVWACLFASVAQASPFLEGRVTDEQGRPIAGACVKIWDCIGTCLGGKAVLTDENGHYVFEKKSFRNFPSLAISMPGRYEVSRDQSGPALHEPDGDTPRRVDFILGTPAAATVRLEGDAPEGWSQSLLMRPGQDKKVHRYDERGEHVSGWDYWNFELLPRQETLHLVVVRKPDVVPSDDEKEMRERQREARRRQVEIVAPGIRLPDPQRYEIRARIVEGAEGESPFIIVDAIRDAISTDRTEELVESGSLFGPPVDEGTRQQALDLLERVKAAASPWNALPPKSIARYEYDAVTQNGEVIHVKRDPTSSAGPAWSDISRIRGFAYMPPLRWLFSQPENVEFHAVSIDEKRATIDYRLKSHRGFGAGLGVGPSWNGFFTTSFSAGRVVIDVPTATVLEHRLYRQLLGEESVETFSDYVAVGEGFCPRSMRIQTDGFDMRLRFEVHENSLWLLKEASHGEQNPVLRIENVVITLAE